MTPAADMAHDPKPGLARWLIAQPGVAYACVFAFEAGLFAVSALLARRIVIPSEPTPASRPEPPANVSLALASSNR